MQNQWQITYTSPGDDHRTLVMGAYTEPSREEAADYIIRNDVDLEVDSFSGRSIEGKKEAMLNRIGFEIIGVDSLA